MTDSVQKMVASNRKETTASIKKTLSEENIKEEINNDNAQNDMSDKKEATETNKTLSEERIKETINIDNVQGPVV